MPWFVKIEKGIVEKPIFARYVADRKAYVQQLIAKRHQAPSGYWGCRGGGMLLFQADSIDQAQAIVAQDPLVQNGCVSYELYEWCVVVE